MAQRLTEDDLVLLDDFLGTVLDRYKNGQRTRVEAISDIAHLVVALDKGPSIGSDPGSYMQTMIKRTKD